MGLFTDRRVIIVGTSGSIGWDVAQACAAEGAQVVCNPNSLQRQATEQEQAAPLADNERTVPEDGHAGTVCVTQFDLSTESGIDTFFDSAIDELDALHVLIVLHDFVPSGQDKPMAELSLAEWNQCMNLYLRRPFFLFRRACEEFVIGGERGRIVSIAPAAQITPGQAGYITFQSALQTLQRSIVKEYGPRGIACNQILLQGQNRQSPTAPSLAAASYNAILRLILFLASDEASYVNGESFELANSVFA